MTPERRKEVAAMGGRAAQRNGSGRRWNAEQAREAGLKGGRTTVERHGIKHMRDIAIAGGTQKGLNHAARLAKREARRQARVAEENHTE